MFFTQLVLYVGSLKKKSQKRWQQEEKIRVNLFFWKSITQRRKKIGKQYLRRGKQIQGSSPFNDDVLLLLLILGHVSTSGK